ncbi:MAG: CPBP family intramembrane metalloprotease [Clostridia bacterium]|nr:CPBP family intramembrane metalloprotease [Clostridia bacterium]
MKASSTIICADPKTGRLSEDTAKRYFSLLGFGVFSMSVVTYLTQLLLMVALMNLAPSLASSTLVLTVISFLGLYGFGLPCLLLALRRLPKAVPTRQKTSPAFVFGGLLISFACVLAGNSVSSLLLSLAQSLLGVSPLNPVEVTLSGGTFWLNLAATALLAPILEELIFRKLLCDRLLPLGEGYAVVLSACIFALFHGNFYQLFYAFLIGLCFAYVYVKSGRLSLSILFHVAINLLFGVLPQLITEHLDLETVATLSAEWLAGSEEAFEALTRLLSGPAMIPAVGYVLIGQIQSVGAMAGSILLSVLLFRRKLTLEKGSLLMPEGHTVSPVFLNFGVALSIAFFCLQLILSLL